MQDNNAYEVYKDKNHNLWFALNNGISKSEHSQDLSFWNKHSGLKGTVFAMLRFEGKLYICTSSGIYYMENNQIREVKNAPIGQCWTLFSYTPPNEKPILLAGTLSGLYQINGTEAQQIRKGGHAFTIYQRPSDSNRIFSTEIANLVAMRYEKGKWIDEGIIKGVKE